MPIGCILRVVEWFQVMCRNYIPTYHRLIVGCLRGPKNLMLQPGVHTLARTLVRASSVEESVVRTPCQDIRVRMYCSIIRTP